MRSDSIGHRRAPLTAWLLFGGFSLPAVLIGCWVVAAHGAPSRAWIMNLAAWAAGAGLALAVARAGRRLDLVWPLIAPVGLAATFLSPGLSGVHRWIGLGPIRLNAAALLLPPALVGLAAIAGSGKRPLVGVAMMTVVTTGLLALQPDTSQAAAFVGASIAMLMLTGRGSPGRVLLILLLVALGALSGLRPDPLKPVPEVEGILQLAAAQSPAVAAMAVLALAGAILAPLSVVPIAARPPASAAVTAACALTIYFVLCAIAPTWGAFPVPLVGLGVSPILGAWLGFGALMSLASAAAPPS